MIVRRGDFERVLIDLVFWMRTPATGTPLWVSLGKFGILRLIACLLARL